MVDESYDVLQDLEQTRTLILHALSSISNSVMIGMVLDGFNFTEFVTIRITCLNSA